MTVFKPGEGPCYRCLFPEPPPPELAPSCAEGGVLGVLPGIMGSLQASEAIKLAARDRRSARRPAAALRRARDDVHRDLAPPRPRLPGVRRAPDDHRVHRLRRVLRGPRSDRDVRIPPTLRSEVGGEREVEATGATLRDLLDDLASRFPGLGEQVFEDGEIAPLRERLRGQRGRAHARRARHAARRGLDASSSSPRWRGGEHALAPLAARDRRRHAARRAAAARPPRACGSTRSSRARTRPGRSRIASRRRWSRRPKLGASWRRAASCSSRRAATRGSPSRSSRSSRATGSRASSPRT